MPASEAVPGSSRRRRGPASRRTRSRTGRRVRAARRPRAAAPARPPRWWLHGDRARRAARAIPGSPARRRHCRRSRRRARSGPGTGARGPSGSGRAARPSRQRAAHAGRPVHRGGQLPEPRRVRTLRWPVVAPASGRRYCAGTAAWRACIGPAARARAGAAVSTRPAPRWPQHVLRLRQDRVLELRRVGDPRVEAATRFTGASRYSNSSSAMRARSRSRSPSDSESSCATMTLFVFFTDAAMVSMSSGFSERRSMTSTLMPRSSPRARASSDRFTTAPHVTTVRSVPSRTTFALPSGIMKFGPGSGPCCRPAGRGACARGR
jgi:hypothetical protein